jgi:two-component system, NarL family, response regulator DesR
MHIDKPDYQKMRLMIVDDHASTREMIRNFLDLPGITFCECASGEEALLQAREFKPNWITVDVNMPGLDGFQAAEALRAEHPSAHIIIVTGYNEPHFRKLSNSVGAVGLICKENLSALHMMLSNEMPRPVSNTLVPEN